MAKTARQPAPPSKGRSKGSGMVLSGLPRVNLLPPREIERRATTALTKRWLCGVLATALLVSAVVAATHWVRASAELQLIAEQDRTAALNHDLASLAEVSAVLNQRAELSSLRGAAMGNDLEWRNLFRDITKALPKGSEIRSFDLLTGANPATDADPTATIGVIGRLTLWSKDPKDLDRMVGNLRELHLTLSADAASLAADGDEGFSFSVEFVVNQAHYSGRFVSIGGAR